MGWYKDRQRNRNILAKLVDFKGSFSNGSLFRKLGVTTPEGIKLLESKDISADLNKLSEKIREK